MHSQASQRKRVSPRVERWLYLSAFLLMILSVLLRGIADRFGLQTTSYFILRGPLALLFVALLIGGRARRGLIPTITLFVGAVLLSGFEIFPRLWLLVPALGALAIGAIIVGWPQLRDHYHRLSSSYREISASSKT